MYRVCRLWFHDRYDGRRSLLFQSKSYTFVLRDSFIFRFYRVWWFVLMVMVWYCEFIIVLYISYMLHNPSSNALCMLYDLVEQELLTLPENLSSPQCSSGVRVTRSLVLCVCFVDLCLSFCTFFFWPLCCLFFFDIRIVIAPFISSNSSYLTKDTHWKQGRSESVQGLSLVYLYIYIAAGDQAIKKGWNPINSLTPPQFYTYLKPGSGFLTSYIMVFLVFIQWRWDVIIHFVDSGDIVTMII